MVCIGSGGIEGSGRTSVRNNLHRLKTGDGGTVSGSVADI